MSDDLAIILGEMHKQRIQGRSDPQKASLPPYLGREVEREVGYNLPADPGATNPEQAVAGAQHTHGTPDGTIAATFNIWASDEGDEEIIYVPNHVRGVIPCIRGSFRKWEITTVPVGATTRWHVIIPGFYDPLTMRRPDLGGEFNAEGTDGNTGTLSDGIEGEVSGININPGLLVKVELVQNGDDSDTNKAVSCALTLHGHRNKTYDRLIIRQLDPNDDDPSDIPVLPPGV